MTSTEFCVYFSLQKTIKKNSFKIWLANSCASELVQTFLKAMLKLKLKETTVYINSLKNSNHYNFNKTYLLLIFDFKQFDYFKVLVK